MEIRRYRSGDEKAVRRIHYDVGFLGKSWKGKIDNKGVYSENLDYYLKKEPDSCFVLCDKERIVGYLLGCLDDEKHHIVWSNIVQHTKNLIRMPFMTKKDIKFHTGTINVIFASLFGISEELKFKVPKNAGHIHVNLLPEYRGKDYGTGLLKTFEKYARSKKTRMIHADAFGTNLNKNTNFWLKNGFKLFSKAETSFYKNYYPKEKMYLLCYVKRL